MVATAIYSVTMVLRKGTAFPLCGAMERRWKREKECYYSSVFTCIGALGTPAERGPSLESISRFSLQLIFVKVIR